MCYSRKIILVPVVILTLVSQLLAEPQGKLNPRINNGYVCDTTIAPYYVIITSNNGTCGGSLITYSWVLTASHCLSGGHYDEPTAKIHSGYDMEPKLKQVRNVKETHLHPNFNVNEFFRFTDLRYDIGLILVDEPFSQTAVIRVATLPAPGFTKQCNDRVIAAGVGRAYTNEPSYWAVQRALKCVNLSIIDTNICRKNYSSAKVDTTRFICTYAPQGNEGPCRGDSGGPLICDSVVIGLVSTGGECSKRTKPTMYTKVESYLDFIDHLVKFTGISIKHALTNDSHKTNANTSNKHDDSNGTSVGGKKAPNKSSAQGLIPNWKFILLTLLYLMLLYR